MYEEPGSRQAKRLRRGTALGDLTGIQAAILAGGQGMRLRSVLGDRQKVLAQIGELPFLTLLLDRLAEAELRDVVLCTGYRGEDVEAAFGSSYRRLSLHYSLESKPLGTAGALRHALPFLTAETILVMNGDSFCDADLSAFIQVHRSRRAMASILLVSSPDVERYGLVAIDAAGRIVRFEEKSAALDAGGGWINAGVYLITRSSLLSLPDTQPLSLERDVFPSWLGKEFFGAPACGRFIDIGTPDAYARAEEFFFYVSKTP